MSSLFATFSSRLEAASIPYMVTGSVAAMFYGEPRLTHDVDLVVELNRDSAIKLVHFFPEMEFYCPPLEVIEVERRRAQRGHFNIIEHATGFKADVYLIGQDAVHHWAMKRRRTLRMGDDVLTVAPPEYVIVRKLEYYREGGSEKHIRDIQGILRLSMDQIDTAALEQLICDAGLASQWQKAKQGLDE